MSIEEGKTAHFSVSFDDAAMKSFRALSGDHNPVHFDAAEAKKRGFKGPIVYGGLMVAAVSRLLGQELPGAGCVWQSLSLEFVAPLYVNQNADVTGTVNYVNPDLGLFQVKINIVSGGLEIARGKAQGGFAVK